jgi:alpha(1,3/1,4) fucosyltransferase
MDLYKLDKNIPPFPSYILEKLNQKYEFVWSEDDADYYIWFEGIYSHFYCINKFKKLYNTDKINIFTSGEAFTPDLNLFDYTFSYDALTKSDDRIHRLLPVPHLFNRQYEFNESGISFELSEQVHRSKNHFCNFIYSNAKAPNYRDELFHKLSEEKFVNSLGNHLNNSPHSKGRKSKTWYEDSIELKKQYRFSIACENALFPGYTSEKILSSFEARTIPIYWGNPLISEEFNPKSFINCHDYETIEDVLSKVLEIENDSTKWINMLREPKRTSYQSLKLNERLEDYYNAWDNIFSKSLEVSSRIKKGTFINSHRSKVILGIFFVLYASFIPRVLRKVSSKFK